MIPPVRTDPVWGRAQSGPVPPEGRTGPGPILAVLDWTGLVRTGPNRIIFINFKVDPKNYRSETVIPATLTQTQPEGRSAAKAQWEADKCCKHFGYRLKGKAGNRRPIPMTSAKSLATRFYKLKCGHAPTGAASLSFLFVFLFLLSAGTKGSRWELRHLTGSPGGGGNKGLSYSS